jgi:hypothetical protein
LPILQIRVFFSVPGSSVADNDVPDSFYNLSGEEIRNEARMRRERLEHIVPTPSSRCHNQPFYFQLQKPICHLSLVNQDTEITRDHLLMLTCSSLYNAAKCYFMLQDFINITSFLLQTHANSFNFDLCVHQ